MLASGDLTAHKKPGDVTELTLANKTAVRWIRVHLTGGIDVQREQSFFEFSEIIGNGTQETPPMVNHFSGAWLARGIQIGLRQSGAAVSGCYDGSGRLEGTVTGNILRAAGADELTGVKSHFLLNVVEGSVLRGLRSTNGGPFRLYAADAADPSALKCTVPGAPTLGCGSVIHGISFDFDSATIRPESDPILSMLYEGLRSDPSSAIVIEGHTSSEGSNEYNQGLSERRAASVVADLTRRGIAAGRLRAAGAGESRPIANNADESGRSLNRRVEIRCGSGPVSP
jgi:outer membrane protein OmpA-like peptidoglycan-associated protein